MKKQKEKSEILSTKDCSELKIEIKNKGVIVNSEKLNGFFSCYDVIAIQKMLSEILDEENLNKAVVFIYDNSDYLNLGKKRKCDCWIENNYCYCETITETKEDEKKEENEQLTLF